MNRVLNLLESTKFPNCRSRKNVGEKTIKAFALGTVNYRGQKSLEGRTRGPSRFNKMFPKLYGEIRKLIKTHRPAFPYTTIQVNKNVCCDPHVDKNNVGPSYIIALGDYTGGKLVLEGKQFDIHNRWKKFDGRLGHWVTPFKGTRYSLVYFTHTFKPPSPSLREVEVTTHGLYKKNKIQRSYMCFDRQTDAKSRIRSRRPRRKVSRSRRQRGRKRSKSKRRERRIV